MTQQPEPMTQGEALLWLAGLERVCPNCNGVGVLGRDLPAGDVQGNSPIFSEQCTSCNRTGRVPVLPSLREPCPCLRANGLDGVNHASALDICKRCYRSPGDSVHCRTDCLNCAGTSQVLKQAVAALAALYDAMLKDGWGMNIAAEGGWRMVTFYLISSREDSGICSIGAQDADDWLAAVKAMKAEGDS